MSFFLHTLTKSHFPCSTDSPKANFPVVSSISSIHLFGTSHRELEVPWMQKMTQNESTTPENCGWGQLEKQKEQVTSTTCALFGSRNKGGHAKMKASTFGKRQFWFCHTADKVMWSTWNYLTGPPTSPVCKEVTQHIPEQDRRGAEGQITDKRISAWSWAEHHLSKQPIWWFRNQHLFVTTSLSQWNKLKDEHSCPVVTWPSLRKRMF